jgi:trehalose 6-phosphate phosphatase
MAYGLDQNAVLTDPPTLVPNLPLLSSSPYSPSSTSGSSVPTAQQKMLSRSISAVLTDSPTLVPNSPMLSYSSSSPYSPSSTSGSPVPTAQRKVLSRSISAILTDRPTLVPNSPMLSYLSSPYSPSSASDSSVPRVQRMVLSNTISDLTDPSTVVLTDPPVPVPVSPLLSFSLSSPYSPSSTGSSVPRAQRKVLPSVNGIITAMRASSPTHASQEAAYRAWTGKHPSALTMFEKMMDASKGKQIVVFLDYDGTLSPIVNDPDRAYMSKKMRQTVREVARYFPTAIITGRCTAKVYEFVKLAELYYAGSHGMDIMGPAKSSKGSKADMTRTTDKKGGVVLYQAASEFLPMIDKVFSLLVEKTKRISGALVENHKFCLSVHYRCVEEKSWAGLAEQVRSVINEYPQLRLTQGRKVLEIRPIIKWDKGKALEYLLVSLGLANRNDVLPLYIGDDRTDEDAFKVLRDRGQGYGILVSTAPQETNATYSLKEPSEVMKFLDQLVKWKGDSSKGPLSKV